MARDRYLQRGMSRRRYQNNPFHQRASYGHPRNDYDNPTPYDQPQALHRGIQVPDSEADGDSDNDTSSRVTDSTLVNPESSVDWDGSSVARDSPDPDDQSTSGESSSSYYTYHSGDTEELDREVPDAWTIGAAVRDTHQPMWRERETQNEYIRPRFGIPRPNRQPIFGAPRPNTQPTLGAGPATIQPTSEARRTTLGVTFETRRPVIEKVVLALLWAIEAFVPVIEGLLNTFQSVFEHSRAAIAEWLSDIVACLSPRRLRAPRAARRRDSEVREPVPFSPVIYISAVALGIWFGVLICMIMILSSLKSSRDHIRPDSRMGIRY